MVKSLYVHIPFCLSKCRYCGFYSVPTDSFNAESLLAAEITELKKTKLNAPPNTIYIGGGSPGCLGEKTLCAFLQQITDFTGRAEEFTVELNPNQVDESMLRSLAGLGVNRISIGTQSFSQRQLDFLGRNQRDSDTEKAVTLIRKTGIDNIGLDLIFALPGSDIQSWQDTLKRAINCRPQHISAYSLSYEINTPLSRMLRQRKISPIDEQLDRDMYQAAIDLLTAAGFEHYEISNFAKPGKCCIHNLTYWLDEDYLGIGPAAGTHIGNKRLLNVADVEKYTEAMSAGQSAVCETETAEPKEAACEKAVLGLRKIKGIEMKKFKAKSGFDLPKLFSRTIAKYRNLGLIEISNGFISLTAEALPIADSVLCDFSLPD